VAPEQSFWIFTWLPWRQCSPSHPMPILSSSPLAVWNWLLPALCDNISSLNLFKRKTENEQHHYELYLVTHCHFCHPGAVCKAKRPCFGARSKTCVNWEGCNRKGIQHKNSVNPVCLPSECYHKERLCRQHQNDNKWQCVAT